MSAFNGNNKGKIEIQYSYLVLYACLPKKPKYVTRYFSKEIGLKYVKNPTKC